MSIYGLGFTGTFKVNGVPEQFRDEMGVTLYTTVWSVVVVFLSVWDKPIEDCGDVISLSPVTFAFGTTVQV